MDNWPAGCNRRGFARNINFTFLDLGDKMKRPEPETRIYYFGRGSGPCVRVEMVSGHYAEIGMGNGKTREKGETMLLSRIYLHELSEFFLALLRDHGEVIFTEPLTDDPCDPAPHCSLEFDHFEEQ